MSNNIQSYRELIVWKESRILASKVYSLTKLLPNEEKFGLSSQMQRAAVSIPSNIAEGEQRYSTKDYIRFLYTSRGSLGELLTQLEITEDLYPHLKNEIMPLVAAYNNVARKLNNLITSLRNRLRIRKQEKKKKNKKTH